ncbi:transcriptional regulator, IclR family [Geomicrobium sp. JCM 19055]|nr:transcriptional regulator, IclR family [Geomicrobium sp. JCM 19055]
MVEGLRQLGNHSLRSVAHPIMKEMSLELKESIYLSIPGKYSSTLIERLDSPARVRVVDNLGDRFAMHLGAPNKVMLAFSTFEFVQDVLNYYGETDQEEHYTRELAQIKKLGYAISYGEITEGTIAIAAPILGMDDNVQGALCLNLIQHQVSDEYVESLISPIMKGAGKVSRRVGGK